MRPTSVRLFLVDGTPDGLKIVEKSNWTGQALVCSRAQFPAIKKRPELNKTGVYLLLGREDDGSLPIAYIGEGDPVRPRLESHEKDKDFWENRPTKGRYWRSVPIESDQVLNLLKEMKVRSAQERHEPNRKFVLHHFKSWTDGEAAGILREFCVGSGLPSVRFHTLRACFATQLVRDGIAPAVVMKICGWKDLKTMQRYIRLAGIEVKGATQGLKLLPEREVMGRVVNLFRQQ